MMNLHHLHTHHMYVLTPNNEYGIGGLLSWAKRCKNLGHIDSTYVRPLQGGWDEQTDGWCWLYSSNLIKTLPRAKKLSIKSNSLQEVFNLKAMLNQTHVCTFKILFLKSGSTGSMWIHINKLKNCSCGWGTSTHIIYYYAKVTFCSISKKSPTLKSHLLCMLRTSHNKFQNISFTVAEIITVSQSQIPQSQIPQPYLLNPNT